MELHGYVQQALRILSEEKGGLDAVFFMDDAACLCSKNLREGSVRAKIRDGYAALGRESGAQLLCCGRAFSDLGTAGGDVADGFQLAGNFELSALFAKAERTVEF
jgi:sulfur relay (sulfurtransferase) complex TusBCD TusD component (DsrE family)